MIKLLKKPLYAMVLLIFSSQLLSQNDIQNTNLDDSIIAHEVATIAEAFTIDQAMNKAHIISVKLSPNGEYIVYVTREDKGVALHLFNVKSKTTKKLFDSYILKAINWSTDSEILFLQGANYLAYVDPFTDNPTPKIFYQFENKNEESFYRINTSQPQQVLISRKLLSKSDSTPYQLLSVSINGDETILYADKIKIYDHLFDKSGQLAFIRQPNKQEHVIYQLNGQQKTPVYTCIVIDKCRMIKFDQNNQTLYILGFGDYNLRSLYSYDLNSKSSELVHQDPEQIADLQNLIIDEKSGEILQLDYHTDRLKHYSLNESDNSHFKYIESQLDGHLVIDSNKTENWLIIQRGPLLQHHKYYIYNRMNHQITSILEKQRAIGNPLPSNQLVSNIPITYQASDGMTLYGYIMLPKGKKLSEVPLLTYVHGGPFNRNRGGFSPNQYLVNQGYAVFQPNFRASTGYGLDYMYAGKEKFSTRVQEDILDGIDFLINQGIGDRTKLGVFGHSFGGYSVLSLLSQYPDTFMAGVATAPGTDLLKLLKTMDQKGINEYDGVPLRAALPFLLADMKDKEKIDKIKRTAPHETWKGITKPLLMWAGRKDQRISITHLRDYALKLKLAGKSIEFIEDKKVGHNPPRKDKVTRKAILFMTSEFFNRHILETPFNSDEDTDNYLKKYRVY